jgi:hypothetical protein
MPNISKKKTRAATSARSVVTEAIHNDNIADLEEEFSYGLLWNGFYYEWNGHPHRLSILGSRFSDINFGNNNLSANHTYSLKIGSFPKDTGDYNIPYRTFRSKRFFVGYGASNAIPLSCKINSVSRISTSHSIKLSDLVSSSHIKSIKSGDSVLVALNGFKITNKDAFNFTAGWHFGGLGIGIENTKVVKDKIKFDITAFVNPSESADVLTQADSLFGGWDSDNPCQYNLLVDYVVFVGSADRMNIVERTYHSSEESTIFHENTFTFPAPVEVNPLRLVNGIGGNKYPKAIPAITGFEVDISTAKKIVKKHGRYIRSFGINVQNFTYDSDSGISEIGLQVRFANGKNDKKQAIKTSAKFDIETSVNAALIQVNGCGEITKRLVADITSKDHNNQKKKININW